MIHLVPGTASHTSHSAGFLETGLHTQTAQKTSEAGQAASGPSRTCFGKTVTSDRDEDYGQSEHVYANKQLGGCNTTCGKTKEVTAAVKGSDSGVAKGGGI
jgi:hypothetical protein